MAKLCERVPTCSSSLSAQFQPRNLASFSVLRNPRPSRCQKFALEGWQKIPRPVIAELYHVSIQAFCRF